MKVWITKYALSDGIEQINSENMKMFGIEGGYLSFCRYAGSVPEVYSKGNWHKTKEAAIAKAEEMRQKKIASLKKQIEKLEGMKFE